MAAENQHKNVRLARDRLAAIADKHELMISHGKGPQVGPLAWRQSVIELHLINRPRRGLSVIEIDSGGSKPEAGTLPAERGRTFTPHGGQHAPLARSASITAQRPRHDVLWGTRTQPNTTRSVR